jgi:HPt (histidine-containing phosphotransfer) domain-containing protein
MATRRAAKPKFRVDSDVFDRPHLARYTMDSAELEREIIALFLIQLPATIGMIDTAASAADWKLATHTLKGAAAAIGAWKINRLAAALEAMPFAAGGMFPQPERSQLDAAIAEFRVAARRLFGKDMAGAA